MLFKLRKLLFNLLLPFVAVVVIVSACGGGGNGGSDTNESPVANAGSDQTVAVGSSVTLDGNASSDPDSDPLSYVWSFSARPAGSSATLSDATAVAPSFTPDVAGDYVVELSVSDGQAQDTDAVTVTATDTTDPGLEFSLTSFEVGEGPDSIITDDFDGDGVLDLALSDIVDDNFVISVLLGNGTGDFGTATNFPGGSNFSLGNDLVVSGDFNGDGNPDIAAIDLSSVSVLLGDGTGDFGTVTNFSIGDNLSSPVALAVASGDFDGDGDLDLAVTGSSDSSDDDKVFVLLGDGTGGFGTATDFTVGENPFSVISGDFDGDNALDIATANSASGDVSVLLGDGTGGFGTATNFSVGGGSALPTPLSVTSGDFNRDGALDIATANGTGSISVLLGDGTGGFGTATNFPIEGGLPSVISNDLNGDGLLDLTVTTGSVDSGTTAVVAVLLGDGAGGFAAAVDFLVSSSPGSITTSVTSDDFNGDGLLDLAATVFNSGSVAVLLQVP